MIVIDIVRSLVSRLPPSSLMRMSLPSGRSLSVVASGGEWLCVLFTEAKFNPKFYNSSNKHPLSGRN